MENSARIEAGQAVRNIAIMYVSDVDAWTGRAGLWAEQVEFSSILRIC